MNVENPQNTVLVVDDDPTNLEVLFLYLDAFGFNVSVAENGEIAVERAHSARPDIILLDVLMPGIDGFETCRRLKNDAVTRDIPIIFMTAMKDTEDKIKGFEMGAVDYIAKPFQQTEVLARLKTHLSIRNLQKSLQERNERLQQEINERKRIEAERKQLTEEVKSLRGLLPICVNCKKIRDEDDSWHDVAVYIRDRSEADFTHGLCPECAHELYPGFDQK